MRLSVLLAGAILLAACNEVPPQSIEATTNPGHRVARLFAVDGCIVYRFRDRGDYHYFVRCGLEAETATAHLRTDGEQTWTEYKQIPTWTPEEGR